MNFRKKNNINSAGSNNLKYYEDTLFQISVFDFLQFVVQNSTCIYVQYKANMCMSLGKPDDYDIELIGKILKNDNSSG